MTRRYYLVIFGSNSGYAEMYNVGVFAGANEHEAVAYAQHAWRTTAALDAYPLDEMESGWSYYEMPWRSGNRSDGSRNG